MKQYEHDVGGVKLTYIGSSPPVVTQMNRSYVVFTPTGFGKGDGVHPTPGSYTKIDHVHPYGAITYTGTSLDRRIEGVLSAELGMRYATTATPDPFNKALTKLYNIIRMGEVAAGVAGTAERSESASLLRDIAGTLRHPVRTFVQAAKDLARSLHRAGGAKTLARKGSSAWLSYTYGFKPAAQGLHDALTFATAEASSLLVAKARASEQTEGRDSTPSEYNNVVIAEDSRRCELQVWYYIAEPGLFNASRLGLLNPVAWVWEGITLSFVVDWVYDIGGYLANLEASVGAGLQFSYGYRTDTRRVINTNTWIESVPNSGGTRLTVASGRRKVTTKSRTKLVSFPAPDAPRLTLPFKAGSTRILSAAALLQSVLKVV